MYHNANKRKIMQTLTQTEQNVHDALKSIINDASDANIELQTKALTKEERDLLLRIADIVATPKQ